MRILVVDDEGSTRDLVSLILQKSFSVNVVFAASGNEAVGLLSKDTAYDVIVSDYNMPNGTGGDLYKFLAKAELKIPFVLCSSDLPHQHDEFKAGDIAGYVVKPNIKEPLKKIISGLSFIKGRIHSGNLKFVNVQIDTLLRLNQMVCDIFVRLNEEKHVRVLKAGAALNVNAAQRYRAKGISQLFIDSNSLDVVIQTLCASISSVSDLDKTADLTVNLLKMIDQMPDQQLKSELIHLNASLTECRAADAEYEKAVIASELVHKAIHQSIQKIGVSREVELLIKSTVKLCIETISQTPELSTYYANLTAHSGEYLNAHSVLLAHFTCLIAEKMGWSSDITRYKLTLASMLHDITLAKPELAKIKSLEEIESLGKSLSEQDRKDVLNHPIEAAHLVRKLHQIPPDVDRIIEEHHAWAEGGGFPFQKNELEIAPMTAVFIFAHDLTDWIIQHKGSPYAYQNFFIQNRRKFSKGIFKKIFTTITGHSPEVRNIKLKAG